MESSAVPPDRFGEAVRSLLRASEQGTEPAPEALRIVLHGLEAYLTRSFGRSLTEPSDVAAEALVRFLERAQRPSLEPASAPGLITVIARNIAVDVLRQRRREVVVEDPNAGSDSAAADDEIAALLDRTTDAAAVQVGMEQAFWHGDLEMVRIVRAWLDLAQELGREPKSREAGAALGVSHSTVLRALNEFRAFVPGRASQTKSD